MSVFVYQDTDNNVVKVFDSLEKAQAYAIEQWPGSEEEGWESGNDQWYLISSGYVKIFQREVE